MLKFELGSASDQLLVTGDLELGGSLEITDAGGLTGWMDGGLAIDAVRALRLRDRGYRVWTQTIPAVITPKNRLLLGEPSPDAAAP